MKNSDTTPLKMLKDGISFDLDRQAEKDAFSHSTYADVILRILTAEENEPPLTIGLFGPWGIGKSFVVRELFDKIKGRQTPFLPILFNAWQYSGDSFRRQFLIEVARAVYKDDPKKEEKLARLEQLNHTKVLKQTPKAPFLKEAIASIKEAKVNPRIAPRIILGLVLLVLGGVVSLVGGSPTAFVSTILPAVLLFCWNVKFEDVFVLQEAPVYDPQLILPEQFQKEFHDIVKKGGPIGDKTAVIAIDDIDRCHPPTVRDILVSIKTFLGHNNCFIIVPCDDRSVVKVFSEPSQEQGYADESLRKYFDIGVRMAPIMSADLVDFANQVTEKTGIPADVVQVGVLGKCRDGRKIKHFLNTYQIKRDLAQARSIPFTPESLAKAIVIEDQYPDLFDKIVEDTDIYHTLARIAVAPKLSEEATAELAQMGLKDWEDDYPGLKSFLERTRHVAMKDVRLLFSLKATNPEARIPSGTALREAIVSGDKERIGEILTEIPEEAGRDVGQILSHLIITGKGTFLRNAIAMALEMCGEGSLIPEGTRSGICRQVCEHLRLGNGPPLLPLDPQLVMACAETGGVAKHRLVQKYDGELKAAEEMPENLAQIVNTIIPHAAQVKTLPTTVNGKLEKWTDTKAYLEQVRSLDVQESSGIPNPAVLEKIASGMTPNASEATFQMNPLRKDIILRNWTESIIPTVSQRVTELLSNAHSEGEQWSGERTQLCREILLARHGVTHVDTPNLWNAAKQACSRAKASSEKLEAHELALVFAIHSTMPASLNDARAFVKTQWQSFSDEESKAALKQLREYGDEERQKVEQEIMTQELSLCTGRVNNPDERIFGRVAFCVRERKFLGAEQVEQLVYSALDVPSAAFVQWAERIPEYAKKLSKGFASRTSERCLALIPGEGDKTKRDALFTLLAAMVQLAEAAKKDDLLRKYFDLCRHDNVNIRTSALSALEKFEAAMDSHDFKLSVNSLLCSAVRNLSPDKLPEWRDSLHALLKYKPLFGDAEWRDVAALGKNALSHSNAAIAQHGLPLVTALDRIPADQEEDLVHLLIKWAGGAESEMTSTCRNLLTRFAKTEIHSKEAKQAIEEFIAGAAKEKGPE